MCKAKYTWSEAMSNRCYVSPVRAAASAEKRDAVLKAATDLLRNRNISGFSLEGVAKAAGVSRLTVYHQFGSRRGLLEAVLDEIAKNGRLLRIPKAIASPNPRQALNALIDIFCSFWAGDPAIGRLHEACAIDAEFGDALGARNERRRNVIRGLIGRMELQAHKKTQEATDMIFVLTSSEVYQSLSKMQSNAAVRRILKATCAATLDRLGREGPVATR